MQNVDLILTLAGGLGAALAMGYLTNRIGLSPIVGYLLAGVLVGPHTPGFVADRHMAEQIDRERERVRAEVRQGKADPAAVESPIALT